MYNLLSVGKGPQIYKIGLEMGGTIGGDDAKNAKNSHLLVIMCMRVLQKIGLLDLINRTQFKKGNGYKIRANMGRSYNVIMGQCTAFTRSKIDNLSGWDVTSEISDLTFLIKGIK